jgi:hypothetical protein
MNKVFFQIVLVVLLPASTIYNQTLRDYISAVKGDTLVIKDYYEMNNQENSLYYALILDTVDVPVSRVYELKVNGYYPHWNTPRSYPNRHTVIVGSDPTPVVNNRNASSSPPLICTFPMTVDPGPGGIIANGDLTIKNCELTSANVSGSIGWTFADASAPNLRLTFDNCIMDHTLWAFVYSGYTNCSITFRNCYFINMSGYPSRRNGGVLYCAENQDSLVVENCTHVMAQGNMYNMGGNLFDRIIINHNTFINCAGPIVSNSDFYNNLGIINNVSLTNNIFVNCNLHPSNTLEYNKPVEPMGLVNVYPDNIDTVDGVLMKFLAQNNLVYWNPLFADCDSILNANEVNGSTHWASQMIIMNSRTKDMFADDVKYPHLVTDTWKNKMPHFADPKNLFTTQLVNLKNFVIGAADSSETVILHDWRLINTGQNKFVNPDWPIPVDLSYSDATLINSGMGGFPIGDLNWFPVQKVTWLAQREAEYSAIDNLLHRTVAVNKYVLPGEYTLSQNYPNPFNPSTVISYQIPAGVFVTLRVFDVLGREVEILVNERQNAGKHSVQFNAFGLSSGMYFYKIEAGNYRNTKKLLLLK